MAKGNLSRLGFQIAAACPAKCRGLPPELIRPLISQTAQLMQGVTFRGNPHAPVSLGLLGRHSGSLLNCPIVTPLSNLSQHCRIIGSGDWGVGASIHPEVEARIPWPLHPDPTPTVVASSHPESFRARGSQVGVVKGQETTTRMRQAGGPADGDPIVVRTHRRLRPDSVPQPPTVARWICWISSISESSSCSSSCSGGLREQRTASRRVRWNTLLRGSSRYCCLVTCCTP